MTYLIGEMANGWALDEARKAGDGDFGVLVFVMRLPVNDPSGLQEVVPVWFAEVTLITDGKARIHCEPVGVGEASERLVRSEVRNGIAKLTATRPQPDPMSMAPYGLGRSSSVPAAVTSASAGIS